MTQFKDPEICASFDEKCQYPQKALSEYGLEAAWGAVLTEASLYWCKFKFLNNTLIHQGNSLLITEEMLT